MFYLIGTPTLLPSLGCRDLNRRFSLLKNLAPVQFEPHAEGNLPSAPMQLQILTELVSRWTPDHLHDQPLPVELDQIQRRTREYFDRLFAA